MKSSAVLAKRDYAPGAKGPLDGVRILDLSRLFAGNLLTQMLADFGAEVIKIEPPSGDTLRAWHTNGVSIHWKLFARNKKSLCLNLRKRAAHDLLMRLVPTAQMLVESFRPGTLEKMGLAPDTLLAVNSKLVIVRISGWGQSGPYSKRPGFGTLIEGMSGFASLNGFGDREPVLPPMYLADGIAGLYGASAAMIALRNVEINGGHGQVIDLPLLDPLFSVLGPHAAAHRLTGVVKPRTGSRSSNSAPRNAFKCSDGLYVGLSASTEKMAHRLFQAIGRPDLSKDRRYATNAERLKNVDMLEPIIAAFIAARTQAENVAFFEQAEVTIGPIYDISQIVEDPHVIEREMVADYPDAEMGLFPMHHVVPRLAGTPASIRTPAPALGEHNRAILAELGIAEAEYQALVAQGAVSVGQPGAAAED
jgi:crotonobetainyl-CoA:carnitine CoA-transferase CaiB-like acyl-CoA transferase